MTSLDYKFLQATRDILEKNLTIWDKPYIENEILLIYDTQSQLSQLVARWYINNLKNYKADIIDIDTVDKQELIDRLWNLKENSTVILVQSTNFRLDNFRIRLQLHNNGVWCLEHNHLLYMKDDQYENYADAISYMTPYYNELSNKLKEITDVADSMKFVCYDWSIMNISGWFEDMKQNTWNYSWKKRWGTFPIWENFTEAKNFSQVSWELSINIYPLMDFQIKQASIPFKIRIENSLIFCDDPNTPQDFLDLINLIKSSEDNEVMLRELGFWLNPNISDERQLADVNFFERKAWFHISLWKKHQIYRKKLDKSIIQRYHIDIFPHIKEIYIDDNMIFQEWKYIL